MRKRRKRAVKKSAKTVKRREPSVWHKKFEAKMLPYHKRTAAMRAGRIMRRLTSIRTTMEARSKKQGVPCTITVEELREMAYAAYGTACKYTGRTLTVDSMVFDHIHPISKGGPSTRQNLQVISKFANTIKGSLIESDFVELLAWLDKLPPHLKQDVSVRLARGLR